MRDIHRWTKAKREGESKNKKETSVMKLIDL